MDVQEKYCHILTAVLLPLSNAETKDPPWTVTPASINENILSRSPGVSTAKNGKLFLNRSALELLDIRKSLSRSAEYVSRS